MRCANCGHLRSDHDHFRRGNDCAQCACMRFDWFDDETRMRKRLELALDEVRLLRNLAALHRFAVTVPDGEFPSAYTVLAVKPRDPASLQEPVVVIPHQRSKTAAEAEHRLFDVFPRLRVAPDGVPTKPRKQGRPR